jgi:hypothetical protein
LATIIGSERASSKGAQKNLILAGVWFQRHKPKMDTFLDPLVNELNDLSKNGIEQCGRKVRVHLIICTVDGQARAMVMNIHQHNGEFPCPWCEIPGENYLKPGNKRETLVFVFDPNAPRRTELSYHNNAEIALKEGLDHFHGVKSVCILALVESFDVIDGQTIDYLHNLLLGQCESLIDAFLSSHYAKKDWSLRKHEALLDKRMIAITPTSEISRLPAKFSEFRNMKASEKRSLLCYYLLPIVEDLLPEKYLKHLLLLVFSARTYLMESCQNDALKQAKLALTRFYKELPELYDKALCTFNAHQSVHIPEHCEKWGALWDYSCFPYEGYNATLIKSFYGTVCQGQQILQTHQLIQYTRKNHDIFTREQHKFLYNSLTSCFAGTKLLKKIGDIMVKGAGK